MTITPNALYQADCIEVLQRINEETIDLVYLDPPFGSFFKDQQLGSESNTDNSSHQYLQFLSKVCQQTHRVLRQTGVLFFHIEPSFAFSIRLILNQIFGEINYHTELVWQYRRRAFSSSTRPSPQHEVILQYSKSDKFTYNAVYRPLTDEEIKARFQKSDSRGKYALVDLTSPVSYPNMQFEWQGVVPPSNHSWRFNLETLQRLEEEGRISWETKTGIPKLKTYLDENAGIQIGTVWNDIPLLSPQSKENFRYPTQKPLGVLERIILMGSNPGDIVLDPFCGSGTALVAAETLQRHWIGCDIEKKAIEIATKRLIQEFEQIQSTNFLLGDTNSLSTIPVKSSVYKRVGVRIEDFALSDKIEFMLNKPLRIEETRHYEFKEVKSGAGAVDSIVNTCDEYAVAYLNSEGGRIFWGIRDRDRVVVGVRLNYQEKDRIRREVRGKLSQIEPRIDPSQYRIEIHEILDEHREVVPDICVIELIVPPSNANEPYYTGSGETWVKVEGVKQKLKGPALTDFIKRRVLKENS